MKVKERILAWYYDHNNEECYVVSDEHDMVEFMKYCYKQKCMWDSNYTMNNIDFCNFEFFKERYIVFNNEEFIEKESAIIDNPLFFKQAKPMFIEYRDRVIRTITHLREASDRKKTELKERKI